MKNRNYDLGLRMVNKWKKKDMNPTFACFLFFSIILLRDLSWMSWKNSSFFSIKLIGDHNRW